MAVNDVYAVDFHQTVRGNPVMNTLHYLQTEEETDPDAVETSLANGFAASVADAWALRLSEDWVGQSIQVRRIVPSPINPFSIILTGGEAIVGAVASEAIPSNSPLVVTKYTTWANRRGRGRWYQSGIPETIQDGGQILAASLAGLVTAAVGLETWLAEIAGGGGIWKPCVVTRVAGPVPVPTVITSTTVRPNLANMRPRRSPPATA